MRPIILHGHERPITRLCFNRDGDLLFTAGKNSVVNVWFTIDGARLGTYHGHTGVVWWVDVDRSSKQLLTASGDHCLKLWDVETGVAFDSLETEDPLRSCGISSCGNMLFGTSDQSYGRQSQLFVMDKRDSSQMSKGVSSALRVTSPDDSKITGAIWGPCDRTIILGHESGALNLVDLSSSGKVVESTKPHKELVTDLKMHLDLPIFISASKDHTSIMASAYDLSSIRTFTTERPINSAAMSSTRDHVLLGGGQEASEVTTTSTSQGMFDTRLYNYIYQEEIGRIKGHFGPVNTVSFNSDGTGFATGGEDGFVRLHIFDPDYASIDNRFGINH